MSTYNSYMEEELAKGTALDVLKVGIQISPTHYELNNFIEGKKYCDSEKKVWIHSIGLKSVDSKIIASTQLDLFNNVYFTCIYWQPYKTDVIDFTKIISKFDKILKRGLRQGAGDVDGTLCVEQAVCSAMDLPISDVPICVTREIRDFKVCLNDANWSNDYTRAKGLRDLGIAQIGSKDVIDGQDFLMRLQKQFIKIFLPALYRDTGWINLALKCEKTETSEALETFVYNILSPKTDERQITYSLWLGNYTIIFDNIVKFSEKNDIDPDKYLILAAKIALDVLKELKSPGCDWI